MRNPLRKSRSLPGSLALGILLMAAIVLPSTGISIPLQETGSDARMASSPTGPEPLLRERGGDRPKPEGAAGGERARERPGPGTIEWKDSKAIGSHSAGRLKRGVLLPEAGKGWSTWDPILRRSPNRAWRRWGSDRLIWATLGVLREFRRENPVAPTVAVGDLSRPHGGDFGPEFGSIGHASHQNGLDVDVYYPRLDRRPRPPKGPGQVNVELAQDLVDLFVEAGAETVFVGPSLGLTGPAGVVVPLANHDNHLHARLPLDDG